MFSNKTTTVASERDSAIASLREALCPGIVIYTVLRSVSASGMSRTIDLYYTKENQIIRITWSAAKVLQASYDCRREALRMESAGSDMGFEAMHNLSYCLFNDGYVLKHKWL